VNPAAAFRRAARAAVFGGRVLRSRLGRPDAPWKVTFALTYRCNHLCRNCSIWRKRPSRADEMSAAEIAEFFRRSGRAISWLDLTGGEIFTRPDLLSVLDALLEGCPRLFLLHFPTNGMFPARAAAFARRATRAGGPKLIVSVSLDGPPDVHDRLRGVPGAWGRAARTYRLLRDVGVETYFGMTLSPDTLDLHDDTLAALRREFPRLGPRDVHVNFLHRSAHYFANSAADTCDKPRLEAQIRRIVERRGAPFHPTHWLERLYLDAVPEHLRTGRSPYACRSLADSCFIDPSGNVFPCTIWDRPVGRLSEAGYDLERLWREDRVREARREVAEDRCPGCWTPCEAYQSILSGRRKTSTTRTA
jgi:MoaA/NifB/PqqE/SkfB family radical SAM enzyme